MDIKFKYSIPEKFIEWAQLISGRCLLKQLSSMLQRLWIILSESRKSYIIYKAKNQATVQLFQEHYDYLNPITPIKEATNITCRCEV